jgi:hypothetical protein
LGIGKQTFLMGGRQMKRTWPVHPCRLPNSLLKTSWLEAFFGAETLDRKRRFTFKAVPCKTSHKKKKKKKYGPICAKHHHSFSEVAGVERYSRR